jgi:uncharacterized protein YjbK
MQQNIEVESKFELMAADFVALKDLGTIVRCIDQINVYYDCDWVLATLKATFRVRFSSGAAPVLTLKLPVTAHGSVRKMREFEYQLAAGRFLRAIAQQSEIDVNRSLPPDLGVLLLDVGVSRLQRLGWVRNKRYVIAVPNIGQLELDELALPDGQKVFEAEIETEDEEMRARLGNWLLAHAPGAHPSLISKFQRFREVVSSSLETRAGYWGSTDID